MKRKSAELKRLAREILTHRYGIPIAAMVVSELISVVLLFPFSWGITLQSSVREWTIYYAASFVISLVGVILSIGRIYIALCMARGKAYSFRDMFYGFRIHPDKYVLAALLLIAVCLVPAVPFILAVIVQNAVGGNIGTILLVLAASILLLAGEIIVAMRYALVFYLLVDFPQMRVTEVFRMSKEKMNGNKGRLFYIGLSFIGWSILGLLSFGIGMLWIEPYMMQTQICFYLDVMGESCLEGARRTDENKIQEGNA